MSTRVSEEPAYILHSYPWSESSLILEAWSRHQGRVALVAKGAKKPTSQFRAVLLPMQALRLSWGGDAEVRTLKSAQWQGGHVMPTGDTLIAGYYLNELLLRLLVRDDPHPTLFDHYGLTLRALAEGVEQQPALRTFELLLLRELGWLPALDTVGHSDQPLSEDTPYVLMPEGGLRQAHPHEPHALDGRLWSGLQQAMDGPAPFADTLQTCRKAPAGLRVQLRTALHYHSGVRVFKTRQMVVDVQALVRPHRLLSQPAPSTSDPLSP